MEIKNGIIIDGELHEAVYSFVSCEKCSLFDVCNNENELALCSAGVLHCEGFVNRGKVKIEKEE